MSEEQTGGTHSLAVVEEKIKHLQANSDSNRGNIEKILLSIQDLTLKLTESNHHWELLYKELEHLNDKVRSHERDSMKKIKDLDNRVDSVEKHNIKLIAGISVVIWIMQYFGSTIIETLTKKP